MIDIIELVLPYIKGLWTLPWIAVGFLITFVLSKSYSESSVNKAMKKIGLILLYFFVPLLLFRILLSVDFQHSEILFTLICFFILFLMYLLAYFFAKHYADRYNLIGKSKRDYIKTVLTNQGRSSAFVGGALLAIEEWRVFATIYMIIGAIFLFAIIPYILNHFHKKDIKKSQKSYKIHALPWYLRIFPWYLLLFAFAAFIVHFTTGITSKNLGDFGTVFEFITQLTIPAALYYVGAGIHPSDLKISELKKLFGLNNKKTKDDHWQWVRNMFLLTVIITPLIMLIIFVPLLLLGFIEKAWFPVIIINSILPVTSTNMFLLPYGIDKKSTAHIVTWTTLVCVPIVVVLITILGIYFS
jgi:predicted permease